MDLDVKDGKLRDYRYRLLPVFSNLLPADAGMAKYIEEDPRAVPQDKLTEELATAEEVLFRRGNFNGTFDQVICDALRKVNDAQISLSPGFRWGTTVLPGQKITMDNVMDQTCITYPETYRREMKGSEIKAFSKTSATTCSTRSLRPAGRRHGACRRLDYVCDPSAGMGERITDMQLDDGTKVEADKSYVVAGWATVGSQSPGEPIWETVATYLRDIKTVKIEKLNTPKLKNVDGNPGLAGDLSSAQDSQNPVDE
jgi:sulfur-oxidizing protein SoxB